MKRTMKVYELVWSPTGQKIATVTASTMRAAIRKAPAPYSRYKGEIYAREVGQANPGRRKATKKQKKARAASARKRSRALKAAAALVKTVNPGITKRTAGFRVKRLKGGGVSVVPVKIRRRA